MKIRIGTGPGIGASAGLGAEGFNSLIDTCESIGWDSFWFSERVSGDVLDPLAAMGVAIGRTKKLKFGTSVIVLPGRNPVLLAKELASLDVFSNGRIVPVFGLGSPLPSEHEFFGVKRSERAGRTDEATQLIVRLWTEDNVTHEGKYFTVHDLTLLPKPVQQPHPDVWFGGSFGSCRSSCWTDRDGLAPVLRCRSRVQGAGRSHQDGGGRRTTARSKKTTTARLFLRADRASEDDNEDGSLGGRHAASGG